MKTYDANTIYAIKPASRLCLLLYEFIKTLASALLHPFKAELDIDWQFLLVLGMILKNIEPTKYGTLVICGSTSH